MGQPASAQSEFSPRLYQLSAGTGGACRYVLKADASVKVDSRSHKMSKSRGNVINPDDVITDYGADSLRLYEMFMGPLRETKVPGWLVQKRAHHGLTNAVHVI